MCVHHARIDRLLDFAPAGTLNNPQRPSRVAVTHDREKHDLRVIGLRAHSLDKAAIEPRLVMPFNAAGRLDHVNPRRQLRPPPHHGGNVHLSALLERASVQGACPVLGIEIRQQRDQIRMVDYRRGRIVLGDCRSWGHQHGRSQRGRKVDTHVMTIGEDGSGRKPASAATRPAPPPHRSGFSSPKTTTVSTSKSFFLMPAR